MHRATAMKFMLASVAALALVQRSTAQPLTADADGSSPEAGEEYELRWADEFDQDGSLSPDNWGFESGFLRNKELQWYRPDNAWCEDGLLVIEARRERILVDPTAGSRRPPGWASHRTHAEYTSASLNTRNRHEWLYGRFVIRAKIPTVKGAWPAFWTLGHGKWPACGEIDIMEYYDDSILANVAWLSRTGAPKWDAAKIPLSQLGDASWPDRFHVWRMDWDAESIDLYVDDRLVNTTSLADTNNADGAAENPFTKPHYLLVNLAIGGVHGGDPSDTTFPIRYEIDYVRVYQRTDGDTDAVSE